MSFQKLPAEIASIIFKFLPGTLAYQSIFVCKSWQLQATRAFYSKLSLSTEIFLRLQVALQNDWDAFHVGKWIKVLKIYKKFRSFGDMVETRLEPEQFKILLAHLPNLTTIDLASTKKADYYLDLLRDMDERYLRNIQEILLDCTIYPSRQDVFPILYKFRHTLTRLEMDYDCIKLDEENADGISLLTRFTSLKHLITYSYSNSNLSFTEIVNACPNIVSLDFSSTYDAPDSVYDLKTNMKHSRLRNIILGIPTLTKSCMNYLSRCLMLDDLETFYIDLRSDEFYGWVNREGIDNVLYFARQLKSVKNIRFYANPENDGTFELPTAENRMTMLYSLIRELKGNRVMHSHGILSDGKPLEFTVSILDGKKLWFSYGLDCNDYTKDRETKIVLPIPDRNISVIGLEIIDDLEFILVRKTEIFEPNILRYAVHNCPNISSLRVKNWNWDSRYIVEVQKNALKIKLTAPAIPSQEVLDLLSVFLPEAKVFKIKGENCQLRAMGECIVDFTGFRFLEKLTIDTQSILDISANIAFVKFRFTDSNTIDYYKIEPVNPSQYSFRPSSVTEANNSSLRRTLYIQLHRIKTVKLNAKVSWKPIAELRFGQI